MFLILGRLWMQTMDVTALTYQLVRSCKINTWVSWVIITYECCAYILVKIESTLRYQSKYSFENVTEWVIEKCSLINKNY